MAAVTECPSTENGVKKEESNGATVVATPKIRKKRTAEGEGKPKKPKEPREIRFGEIPKRELGGLPPFVKAYQGFLYQGVDSQEKPVPVTMNLVELMPRRDGKGYQVYYNDQRMLIQFPWLQITWADTRSDFRKWLASLQESMVQPYPQSPFVLLREFFLSLKDSMLATLGPSSTSFMDANLPYGETLNLSMYGKNKNCFQVLNPNNCTIYERGNPIPNLKEIRPTQVGPKDWIAPLCALSVFRSEGTGILYVNFEVQQTVVIREADQDRCLRDDGSEAYQAALARWQLQAHAVLEAEAFQDPAKMATKRSKKAEGGGGEKVHKPKVRSKKPKKDAAETLLVTEGDIEKALEQANQLVTSATGAM